MDPVMKIPKKRSAVCTETNFKNLSDQDSATMQSQSTAVAQLMLWTSRSRVGHQATQKIRIRSRYSKLRRVGAGSAPN